MRLHVKLLDLSRARDTCRTCTELVPGNHHGIAEIGTRFITHLQIRARMSPLPVAKTPPVGLGATEMTEFLCPCNMS